MSSDYFPFSKINPEEIKNIVRDHHLADFQYEIIMREIQDFEEDLDDNHEVALKLCHFGQNILLNVTEISYHNPSLIFFYGTVNGKESQLIQHVNQISFLLTSVEKIDPNAPPRRIGFQLNESEQN